jgi:hypothetical protein
VSAFLHTALHCGISLCSNPFAGQATQAAGQAAANAAAESVATSARTGVFGAWGGGGGTTATNQSADYAVPAVNGGGGDLAAREAALARREAELNRREAQLAAGMAASGGVIKVCGRFAELCMCPFC